MVNMYSTYIQAGTPRPLIDYLHLFFYKKLIFSRFNQNLVDC